MPEIRKAQYSIKNFSGKFAFLPNSMNIEQNLELKILWE